MHQDRQDQFYFPLLLYHTDQYCNAQVCRYKTGQPLRQLDSLEIHHHRQFHQQQEFPDPSTQLLILKLSCLHFHLINYQPL